MKRFLITAFFLLHGAFRAFPQTAAAPMQWANPQFLDCSTGQCVALSGGTVTTSAAGTNTPLQTCASSALTGSACTTPNSNPIVLNSSGYNAAGSGNAGIWPLPTRCYKFVLKDINGATVWTQDNVCSVGAIVAAALNTAGFSSLTTTGFPVVVGSIAGTVTQATSDFYCQAFIASGGTLNTCLDAAKAYVTSNNAGSGKAAGIYIPSGTFPLSGPYTLLSGMQLHGIFPRFTNVPNASPLYAMANNGGTWIDCGGTDCFTGAPLTGIILQGLAFQNFSALGTFGAANVIGMSLSRIQDVFAVGASLCCTSSGFKIYNPQNIAIDNLNIINVNYGLEYISDNTSNWGAGNSTTKDLFIKGYARSAANGNSSVPLLGLYANSTDSLSLMKFVGLTQLQAFSGDGTGTALWLQGNGGVLVGEPSFDDLDIEGDFLSGVNLISTNAGRFSFASVTGSLITQGINLDAVSAYNVFASHNPMLSVNIAAGNFSNAFYGMYAGLDPLSQMQGDFFAGGFSSRTGNAYVSQSLWLNSYLDATVLSNQQCAPANFLSSLWTGSAASGDLWRIGCVPGVGASPNNDLYLTHAGSAAGGSLKIFPPTLFGSSQIFGFNTGGDLTKGVGSGVSVPAGNGEILLEAAGVVNPTDVAVALGSTSTPAAVLKNGDIVVPGGQAFRAGGAIGVTSTKTAGSCVLTITGGIITNVTGC